MSCGCGGCACKKTQITTPSRGVKFPMWLAPLAALLSVGVLAGLALRQPPAIKTDQPAATAPATPQAAPETKGVRNWGIAEPLPRTPGTFRLATYNVENLYWSKAKAKDAKPADGKPAPDAKPGNDEGGTGPKSDAACRAVAAAIKRIDADVLAVQEIESLETLTAFRDKYLSGQGYDFIASIDAGDPRGIECAVLSRFPLSGAKVYLHEKLEGVHPEKLGRDANPEAGKPLIMKRSPLQVTVTIPAAKIAELLKIQDAAAADVKDYQLTLFSVHHKSGREFGFLRAAEAKRTAEIANGLLKEYPGLNVVVLGDCNAQGKEAAIEAYIAAGFTDLFGDRQREDATTITHSSGRAIDHIFFNPDAAKEIAPGSRFVLGTADRPKGSDWRTTPAPSDWASDHYPVVVDLRPVETTPATP
ncbi:MAG: endonuclease/exonuclease/phosphatase family protein [Phycisphaerales bacterium]